MFLFILLFKSNQVRSRLYLSSGETLSEGNTLRRLAGEGPFLPGMRRGAVGP